MLACSVLFFSCHQNSSSPTDTPTTGEIKIGVDESFAPILESHVDTFMGLYKYAKINAQYAPEGQVMQALLQDSIRLAVATRPLNKEEKAAFEREKITPTVIKIAIDGIALIINKTNTDTTLTMQQVRDIFTGKATNWNQVTGAGTNGPITIVFDNSNSSTARYILDSINFKQPLPGNTYATKSNRNLVDYIAQNKNAIGVIGVNWISDRDDSTTTNFLDKVNVVGISTKTNPTSVEDYIQPYQAYLAQGTYPLRREVFIISREARTGLGTGFASFVSGDKGQRIILKSGLVPASMPVRIVGFSEEEE
ncbi:phosphate ABC transporter substrate-binding protein, PhoT family [Nibribacter ruber]|uniref:Phosphate ABC transporter substrate-binding protein, PhoT family n=2 Tax=Nibribacter ruber TaxID=2698458 RepID=A0A6P1P512_9BACT|nr:phosphate ABC transporter substrate-binding protein, PhoT family [Nibribacter ruber]